jgi:hypothetical protein
MLERNNIAACVLLLILIFSFFSFHHESFGEEDAFIASVVSS